MHLEFQSEVGGASWDYRQVISVDCAPTKRYSPSGGGWWPDPLLEVDSNGIPRVEAATTQPLFVRACVPPGAKSGNFTGTVSLRGTDANTGDTFAVDVPVHLEVWPITMPELSSPKSLSTAFTFNTGLQKWFATWSSGSALMNSTFKMLADHRIPADDLYIHSPRPLAEYEALGAAGVKWMNLMDVSGGTRAHSFPAAYVTKVLDTLRPTVTALRSKGLLKQAYVYGFDEMPAQFNASVYQLFGAIKKEFPDLRTVATLDWPTMPADLPLDVWVDEYADYGSGSPYHHGAQKEKERQAWLAAGHEFWWYWCIGPSQSAWMNTFVERPAIQARLLFWLTALHGVTGMLYYETDIWAEQCPSMRPCTPVSRINGTAKTNFNPATWNGNGASILTGGANGDGSFTYPGPHGLLSSIRLENIRDGIEDWSLFSMLGMNHTLSSAADLITQLVVNGTERHSDPSLLENVRRQAAHRIMAIA